MSRESDLLFGLLALRMSFVSPEQFFGVAGPWIVGSPRSLPELLHERGFLRGTERRALEAIVEAQVQVHGHEAIRMAGAGLSREVRDRLLEMNPSADIANLLNTTRPQAASPVIIATHSSETRYKLGAEVGRGGLGRIVEAEDSALERKVAVKIVLEGLPAKMSERFAREARLTARLEHPNIVPVYDFGALKGPDGVERVFMSMKRVQGRDLGQILGGLAKADPELVRVWSRTRLLMAFQSICLGVAYAHDRGVVHRDLKPANVMIGDYGETLIVDWGLARELGKREPAEDAVAPGDTPPSSRDDISHDDEIVGTPAYMAPEQAEGKKAALDPRMDVYSLGAILYQILSLHPPFVGDTPQEIVSLVVSGHLVPPSVRAAVAPGAERSASGKIPPELDAICMKAMARLAADRYASARELHDEVQVFLEGSRAREQARQRSAELVQRGRAHLDSFRRRHAETEAQAKHLREREAGVQPHQPVSEKRELWEEADRLRLLEDAEIEEFSQANAAFRRALDLDPDSVAAADGRNELLLERYLEAERRRDRKEMLVRRRFLELNDRDGRFSAKLNEPGTLRIRTFAFACACLAPVREPAWRVEISGEATVPWREGRPRPDLPLAEHDLPVPAVRIFPAGQRFGHTPACPRQELPGAAVSMAIYEEHAKRLVPAAARKLGATPLDGVSLPKGSYRCEIRAKGFAPVVLAVRVERGEAANLDVNLFREDEIPGGFAYVPGGPFIFGGEHAGGAAEETRRTEDLFVARTPVTCGEYIAYLDDLCADGRVEEAVRRQPRDGEFNFLRQAGNRFQVMLASEPGALLTSPDLPVVGVSWLDALAYLTWRAKRDGRPWRLMHEEEHEKAARGVDGRVFPWGDVYDGTFSNTRVSQALGQSLRPPGSFPVDDSPYGLLDLAGNTVTWCWNAPEGARHLRSLRGGGWYGTADYARAAFRRAYEPSYVYRHDGIRLCLSPFANPEAGP